MGGSISALCVGAVAVSSVSASGTFLASCVGAGGAFLASCIGAGGGEVLKLWLLAPGRILSTVFLHFSILSKLSEKADPFLRHHQVMHGLNPS